jgi:hypothetical protein
VPPLYAEGVNDAPADCNWEYGKPYLVPDTLWNKLKVPPSAEFVGVLYGGANPAVTTIFNTDSTRLFLVQGDWLEPNDVVAYFYRECLLLLKKPHTLIVIDSSRNIRGHYVLENGQDELDRLATEMDILLENY